MVARRCIPLLLFGLVCEPQAVRAEIDVSPQAAATVLKSPPVGSKRKKGRKGLAQPLLPSKRLDVIPPAPAKLSLPIVPTAPPVERTVQTIPPPRRPYVELAGLGLLIGDYHLQPRLALGTDSRLDDVNIRERVLRDEMDAREAQR